MQTLTETELNGRICNKEFHTSNFGTKKIMIHKEKHYLKRDQFTKKSIILCEAKTNRTKEKADKSTITVEDFNTLFSVINRTSSKCMEKREPLCTVGGNVDWCRHYGEHYGDFSKCKHRNIIWSRNSTSVCISKENQNTNLKRYMNPNVHISIIYNCQDKEAT